MGKRYDVQILVHGEWLWAGVEPMPVRQRLARHLKTKMALNPYWRERVGATDYRVQEVPAEVTK